MNFGKRLIPTGTCRLVFPLLVLGLTQLSGCAPSEIGQQTRPLRLNPVLTAQTSGVEARLIGISPVDENTVWIGGTAGTYARTTDGGTTWHAGVVPDAGALQFRDVHAVDAETAYLLSAGEGEQSRIYKTMDAGLTWALQFINPEPQGFFDCMDFWDAEHGIAFSDSFRRGVLPHHHPRRRRNLGEDTVRHPSTGQRRRGQLCRQRHLPGHPWR